MNHFLKIIVLGLVLAFNHSVLSAELDFNQLKTKLSQELVAKNYKRALSTMKGIRALDIEIPHSFDFFEAKALFETGKKVEAYTLFKTYIDNVGKSGKYFKKAIQYLLKAESAYKKDKNKIIVIDDVMYQNQLFKRFYWGRAMYYCQNLKLEGKGWQLANKVQLEKLLTKQENQGKEHMYYIREEFVNNLNGSGWFWTSLVDENDKTRAWSIFFNPGDTGWYDKSGGSKLHALCTRTKEDKRTAIVNGMIEAKKARHQISIIGNLMWQDESYTDQEKEAFALRSYGKVLDWNNAVNYCENLTLGGFSDWILPSKEQLAGLYKQKTRLKNNLSSYFWSSSTDADKDESAWVMTFNIGRQELAEKKFNIYARCVRLLN